ncbi:MAG: secretin and TonB N-terminal domain-containing protein, partial [Tannerellaceae bacterium]|nr:secretin and TonB N-terminal domain-containing protein [Tannerellaceae bacterium]
MNFKIPLERKRILYVLLMLLLSCSLFSQVTVEFTNKPLKEALKEIENKSSFKFFYNNDLKGLDKIVSLNVSNLTIDSILKQLLSGSEITYRKQENHIILLIPEKAGLTQEGYKKITGIVKDENGTPVIGSTITVKGISLGTITDNDGKFSLDVPQNATIT